MSARDEYWLKVTCPTCGRVGRADWSEHERPSIYSGNGVVLKRVSEGFARSTRTEANGDPIVECAACRVPVIS